MTVSEMTTIISSVIEGGAVITLVVIVFQSLKQNIAGLKGTVASQNETLVVMEKRVQETEKIGALYKKFINDLPSDIDAYQQTVKKLKDEVIQALEEANEVKDEELKVLYQTRLEEIGKLDDLVGSMPRLRIELITTLNELEAKFDGLNEMEKRSGFLVQEFISRSRQKKH
jgi:phage shock protein A